MTDYTELVEALRCCSKDKCGQCEYEWDQNREFCMNSMCADAAAAIEELQAEVERLKDSNEELRDKQTYIDHYGDKWQTSAKDVPTAAYEHGYADGRDEAEAQLPKHGEWVRVEDEESYHYECSRCGERPLYSRYGDVVLSGACPMCGAEMKEVQG